MFTRGEAIVWSILFIAEALAIVAGNLFSIFKFAETGQLYRRSSYLLINLASADILVGACAIPMLVYLIGGQGHLWSANFEPAVEIYVAIDVISGLGSILSLTLVSTERLFATLWPFRHRILTTKTYIAGISFVWFVAFVTTTARMIMRHFLPSVRILFYSSIVILTVCCIVIFVSNVVIWIQVGKRKLFSHYRNAAYQERQLTITLLIVMLISLSAWLPFTILNVVNRFHPFSLSPNLIYCAKLLQYGNSCANVFIYSVRISEFRKTFERICYSMRVDNPGAALLQTQVARLSRETTVLEMGTLPSKLFSKNGEKEKTNVFT